MVRIKEEPSFPSLSNLLTSPHLFFQQLWTWLSYWLTNIKTGHVGHPAVIRSTGQIVREQQPLTTKLRNLLLFSSPLEFIDTTQLFRFYLHEQADVSGKYESSPRSKKQIRPFIQQFGIDMSQFDPSDPDAYQSFNDFFVRTFRPGARPLAAPDDERVTVAVAEARLVAYDSVSLTKKYWIKGREFSIFSLMGTSPNADAPDSTAPPDAREAAQHARIWEDASVSVYRLSPQDYHHYHAPLSGTVTYIRHFPGTYYGVDPLAIRSSVNVLGANARTAIILDTQFGRVLYVAIGAAEVGTVDIKVGVGDKLKKGDEVGRFMYGGSTIFVAFEKGRVIWDEDIREASLRGLMVDVKVLERVGVCV